MHGVMITEHRGGGGGGRNQLWAVTSQICSPYFYENHVHMHYRQKSKNMEETT